MRSTDPKAQTQNPREARALRVRIIRVLAQPLQPAVEIPIHRRRPAFTWPAPAILRSHPTLTQPISQPWLPTGDFRPATFHVSSRTLDLLLAAPGLPGSRRVGKS